MAQWQRTLRLQPEWGQAESKEISVAALASVVGARLMALRPFTGRDEHVDYGRVEVAEEFLSLGEQPDATTDEFDACMDMLYDWADISLDDKFNGRRVCWVDRFSGADE